MKTLRKHLITLFAAAVSLVGATTATAQDSFTEAAVRKESAKFVEFFNKQNAAELKRIYRFDGSLKLPNAPAFNGRPAIENAWAGGFANGLGNLKLQITHLDDVGFNKVVESGTYELEINGPDGTLIGVQKGTYSVMWQYRSFYGGYYISTPKILFDAIDAQSGPGA